MKRLILISAICATAFSCIAQTECNKSNPIFKQDNYSAPKEVYTLGHSPEFPFLRNLTTPRQVAYAIRRATNKHGAAELNSMLTDIGFANGIKDVTASSVSAYYIPAGTTGNMGDGNFNTAFVKLLVGEKVKAWKIASSTECYMYVLAKCGNAFYPAPQEKTTASLEVPVNLNSDLKEITLEGGETSTSIGNTYIYYHMNRHRNRILAPEYADLNANDERASTPYLLNTTKKVEAIPQTYRVTVSTPDNNVRVYSDQPLDLTADINLEKTSEYAGYYPSKTSTQYTEVSKRVYRKSARKMRNALRKQHKVAQLTGIDVNTNVAVEK